MSRNEIIQTARLRLRKPEVTDAQAIFNRYASDPEVTRYLSWPTHLSLAETVAFLTWSDAVWAQWPAGSYLVFSRNGDRLLGGTGLSFTWPTTAVTGYVFARDAWGQGYATESLQAMVQVAQQTGVERLEAVCHVDHHASAHVLEKCGFILESIRWEYLVLPNLGIPRRSDVRSYIRMFN